MFFSIDDPPAWLKQTDLYKEYKNKSEQINTENLSSLSPPQYHQQLHRKQRCNLQMYARSGQSWQSLSSPPLISLLKDNHANELIPKTKREINISPIYSSSTVMDLSTPLNISIKQEPVEQTTVLITNKSKGLKQQSSAITTRRKQLLCKKKNSTKWTTPSATYEQCRKSR